MISVIVCSISPENLDRTKSNIDATIGVEHELIAYDNAVSKWPIAKVYNYCADKAKYDFLLFVHEDVIFHTQDWGKIISAKLAEPDCGVIGFAGARIKTKAYSGWNPTTGDFEISNYGYVDPRSRAQRFCRRGQFMEDGYGQVITVDGLAMFVRKSVWEKYPFDERMLTGFHCYDVDFSLELARHYRNYVCGVIRLVHLSNGNFGREWLQSTVYMHDNKWNAFLPMSIVDMSAQELHNVERRALYGFMKTACMGHVDYGIKDILSWDISLNDKLYVMIKYLNFARLYRRRMRRKSVMKGRIMGI